MSDHILPMGVEEAERRRCEPGCGRLDHVQHWPAEWYARAPEPAETDIELAEGDDGDDSCLVCGSPFCPVECACFCHGGEDEDAL